MEFFSDYNIKATRKVHRCEVCEKFIPIGSPAYYYATKQDGYFYAGHYHADCRVAEVELNKLHDTCGEDWISLVTIDEDPEDCAWLQEAFPQVAERRLGLPKPMDV